MYHLGLSSYDTILELQIQIATSLCNSTYEIGLVCPHQLRHGLFTVGTLDNVDHNPLSATSRESNRHQSFSISYYV